MKFYETVKELIDRLSEFNPDRVVLLDVPGMLDPAIKDIDLLEFDADAPLMISVVER